MRKKSVRFRGFTLVELLVVIAIIAVLSAVGLVMFSGAQKSSRTVKRIQDLKAIQTALELYYSANKGYPVTVGWRSECPAWGGYSSDNVIPGLVPQYMPVFPSDPSMDKINNKSCYIYQSAGTDIDYKLLDFNIADFSSAANYQIQKNLVDPARDGGAADPYNCGNLGLAWAVWSSPTSACW